MYTPCLCVTGLLTYTPDLPRHCSLHTTRHIILVGQDKRELGALVFPDEDYLATAASPAAAGDAPGSSTAPSSSAAASSNGAVAGVGVLAGGALEEVLFKEVSRLNSGRPDYHPEDHIAHIKVGATRSLIARCWHNFHQSDPCMA
jgi:hypothetical protein